MAALVCLVALAALAALLPWAGARATHGVKFHATRDAEDWRSPVPRRQAESTRHVPVVGEDAEVQRASEYVSFQFLDASTDSAVEGVRLIAFVDDVVLPLGQSGVSGDLVVSRGTLGRESLWARCDGFATARVASDAASLADEVTVDLFPENPLRGRVVVPEWDTLPASGVFVLAWPESRPIPVRKTLSELAANPDNIIAEASANGDFALHGAKEDHAYAIVAGGSGWACGGYVWGCHPGASSIEIPILRVYASLYSVGTSTGPPQLNAAFAGKGYASTKLPLGLKGAVSASWVTPQIGLNAALERPIETCRTTSSQRLSTYLVPRVSEVAAPQVFDGAILAVDLPGYAPASIGLSYRLVELGLDNVEVRLIQTGPGFGSIGLQLDGLSPDSLVAASEPEAHVSLIDIESGRECAFGVEGGLWEDSRVRWDGIPAGTYRGYFTFEWQQEPIPLAPVAGGNEIVVLSGAVAVLSLKHGDFGEIVLTPHRNGQRYDGYVRVRLEPADGRIGKPQRMEARRSPYSLGLVRDGAYHLRFEKPDDCSAAVDGLAPILIQVSAGQVAEIPCDLSPL